MDSGSITPVDEMYFIGIREDAFRQEITRLEQHNAEMLAMLKEIADGGRFTEAEVRALIKKVEGE